MPIITAEMLPIYLDMMHYNLYRPGDLKFHQRLSFKLKQDLKMRFLLKIYLLLSKEYKEKHIKEKLLYLLEMGGRVHYSLRMELDKISNYNH